METAAAPVPFLNVEYFLGVLYRLIFGGGDVGLASFLELADTVWTIVTVLAFLFSLAAIGVFVYSTMRLYQVREDEEGRYTTISQAELHEVVESSRWANVMALVREGTDASWRQAIIEADVVLDELTLRLGLPGMSLGERLRAASRDHFLTLDQAWEAHKVRNDIAHQGSQFVLSEQVALRTIANYEAVFREHEEL
jgi:hypothetical protein